MQSAYALLIASALLVPDPHAWPDYGATPDLRAPAGIGLDSEELDRALSLLGSENPSERAAAFEGILAQARGAEAVLGRRLKQGARAENGEMKLAIREAAERGAALKAKDPLIGGLLAISPSDPELGRGASGALAMLTLLRALDRLDTLAAYKQMIEFSPKHAGVFRHEIGRMLVAHGLDALPALVYSRSSPDETVRMYAQSWIRDLGEPRLSDQVKIGNPRRLAQLVDAYGSVHDLDAIDVVVSLINDDSLFVRTAARRALASFGVNAKWSVYRAYENSLGREPASGATVEALLAELYAEADARRMAPETGRFEAGLAAFREGRLEAMDRAYRDVLRADPLFPRRSEMAAGFLAIAERQESAGETGKSEASARMALRVADPASKEAGRARARLEWQEAEALREKGIADVALYRKVLEHDPDDLRARDRSRYLSGAATPPGRIAAKSLAASFFVFLAFLAAYFRLKKR